MDADIGSPRLIPDDEVIADSEEEPMDQGEDFFAGLDGAAAYLNMISSPSTFTALGQAQLGTASGISTFSEELQKPQDRLARVSSIETIGLDKGKGRAADTSMTGNFTDFQGISGGLSIADRAKTRQRSQKPLPSSIIEIESDEEYEVGLKSSNSKAKSKSKPKPKPRPKIKEGVPAKEAPSNIPEVNSEALPKPRPRPRPRPLQKRSKTTHDGIGIIPIPGYRPASTPSPPFRSKEIPIASSTPALPVAQRQRPADARASSPLPPSDPPGPSMSTTYDDHLPRIETLPNQDGLHQPSSPSSLFSDPSSTSRKRKRGAKDVDPEVDQLEPSQNGPPVTFSDITADRWYKGTGYVDRSNMPPPPTFFAGSSQSQASIGGSKVMGGPTPDPIPGMEPTRQNEIVDLTMLPTQDPSMLMKTPAPKPKKPRKPRVTVEDEIPMDPPPPMVLDEDDQDEDFDPKGDGETKKKKKKPKATPKDKTSATAKSSKAKEGAQTSSSSKSRKKVEVVITTKPPRKGKNKEKANDKGKGDNEANKGTFKSAEFIDDSDEEADPLRLVEGGDPVPGQTSTTTSAPSKSKEGGTTSATTPAPPPAAATPAHTPLSPSALPTASSLKAKKVKDPPLSSSTDVDPDMPKASSAKNRPSGPAKRKAVLDSDDEQGHDHAEDDEVVVVRSSSTSKKKQASEKRGTAKGKSKAKNVVLSDAENEAYELDDGEEEPVKVNGKAKDKEKAAKKTKPTKKAIPDDDDEVPQDILEDLHQDQHITEEADATKENIEPPVIKSTPKPPNYTKASATSTTPLYERYEIAPRKSSLPMSELIKRANSMPGSPFPVAPSSSKLKPLTGRNPSSTAYSPYLKSSRSLLSRIAPLHPNRRTPPPPPPPPPPRKKTKKELELEEKWEEELVESVGGVEVWAVMQDDERKELRKAKWARELGGWDD